MANSGAAAACLRLRQASRALPGPCGHSMMTPAGRELKSSFPGDAPSAMGTQDGN